MENLWPKSASRDSFSPPNPTPADDVAKKGEQKFSHSLPIWTRYPKDDSKEEELHQKFLACEGENFEMLFGRLKKSFAN